jgi:hypothetical protein
VNADKQRIAIAEACGWKLKTKRSPSGIGYRYERGDKSAISGGMCYGWGWAANKEAAASHLPDYLHDLNAMHEVEKILNPAQKRDYRDALCIICGQRYPACFATAAQRAEAFLRTIGKWEDE